MTITWENAPPKKKFGKGPPHTLMCRRKNMFEESKVLSTDCSHLSASYLPPPHHRHLFSFSLSLMLFQFAYCNKAKKCLTWVLFCSNRRRSLDQIHRVKPKRFKPMEIVRLCPDFFFEMMWKPLGGWWRCCNSRQLSFQTIYNPIFTETHGEARSYILPNKN